MTCDRTALDRMAEALSREGFADFTLHQSLSEGRLLSHMMLAEDQISSGDVADFDSFAAQIRDRYGL